MNFVRYHEHRLKVVSKIVFCMAETYSCLISEFSTSLEMFFVHRLVCLKQRFFSFSDCWERSACAA
jgi:hypothetical protein